MNKAVVLIKDSELLSHQHRANGVVSKAPDNLETICHYWSDRGAQAVDRVGSPYEERCPPLVYLVLVSLILIQLSGDDRISMVIMKSLSGRSEVMRRAHNLWLEAI